MASEICTFSSFFLPFLCEVEVEVEDGVGVGESELELIFFTCGGEA